MKGIATISFIIMFFMMLPFAIIGFIFTIVATGFYMGAHVFNDFFEFIGRES